MPPEPFPEDIGSLIDRVWADRKKNAELDEQGRFVRGTYQGMTPAEVMADREAFRRAMPSD